MRIVGEVAHPHLKITIFKHEGRFSAKFEAGLLEINLKWRMDERLETVEDVQKLIDAPFIAEVEKAFNNMNTARLDSYERHYPMEDEAPFDEII